MAILHITIPNNNISEREYLIDTVFTHFLGLEYTIKISDKENDWRIFVEQSELIIKDYFFSHFPQELSYLSSLNIPHSIIWGKNDYINEKDIPIIYGNEKIHITKNKIICNIDIFASIFFMLTRWEEYINNNLRDIHNRFEAKDSLAFKLNFLHRPIVNEYIEMIWNMLISLGTNNDRKKRNFNLILTHDIDYFSYPKQKKVKALLGDILKRRKFENFFPKLNNLFFNDPYKCYDWLMDISEENNLKSHFYFMASNNISPLEDTVFYIDNKLFKSVFKKILKREHIIGFHPGYYTYNDPQIWLNEKKMLENKLEITVNEGRQHYLRFEIPSTYEIWYNNGMQTDSSIGYATKEGFRCGTGDDFFVFNFLTRKKLRLLERPLVIMDGTLNGYNNYSLNEIYGIFKYYIDTSKKYKSKLTILFHNSSFDEINWKSWRELYQTICKV